MKLLSKVFKLFIELIPFQFEEIICIVENDDYHFVFYLLELDFSIVVKFSDFIELIPKDVPVPYSIQINVEI